MRGTVFPREARRRPELDLLVGPLEAATMESDGSKTDVSTLRDAELVETGELPTWGEDG
jgi:hypothetical protein